jgi:tetratricopeptide (TPR) repeat protein
VLVTIEALRPDRLQALAAFGRLGAEALVFDDAVSVSPMARVASATVLTGVAPDRHGVRDDVSDRLSESTPTLATAAREAKARTAAFVSTPFCSFASGFDRGFDLFDGPEETAVGPAAFEPPQRAAAEVVDHAEKWIATVPAETPFFAWIHLGTLSGHVVGQDEAKAKTDYGEGLGEVDAALARVLDVLGKRGGAVDLVVVGTHGAHLGEEGRRGAAFWLSGETLRIPLFWRGAGLDPRREPRPAWLPDVPVTLAARMGWSLPAGEGTNLLQAPAAARERRAWTWAPDDQLAWPTLAAVARGGSWVEDATRPAAPRTRTLSPETRAALTAAGLAPRPPGGERKPKDEAARTDTLVRLQRVRSHIAANRELMAMKQARRLQEEHPENLGVLLPWTYIAAVGRDPKRSKESEENLLRDFSDRGEALHAVAHLRWQGDRARAETLLQAAWELGPQEPEILYDLACLRSLAGDTAGALEHLGKAIDRGYRDWRHLEGDLELVAMRKAPGYAELMRAHGR